MRDEVDDEPVELLGVLDRIRAYLAGRPETASGEFTLPMHTGVLRTSLSVGG